MTEKIKKVKAPALETIIDESVVREIIPQLKALGAEGIVEYPLNNLYKDVSGYLSNPSDDGNYALTVGTGGYAAEISKGIINAVGGIGGEITTQYGIRDRPGIGRAHV